ncbi:hypothetical protein KGMB01110_28090 [Mediterraneibacter butyricigenes]|uniref:Signal peptidase I n=1 Tax=Mediterraneibacter butyricigenes TaxID=2316025 RepID=A0A391PF94_9FIRM|nr:signal peptidase I [Mediterraneibacter butyricigenes]GCA68373.1 hypothetical protein KGMB01110_28090 [Mediterraneibacter butyricigenes]
METTLSDGDNLIVDKISYRFRDPKRYDIIVFPYAYERIHILSRYYRIAWRDGTGKKRYVYINGEQWMKHYGNELMDDPGIAEEPIQLGENEYFVLGDNRNHSQDRSVR